MFVRSLRVFMGIAACFLSSPSGSAQTFLHRVVVGSEQHFELPVYATAPLGDEDRLFFTELRTGRIEILDLSTETPLATPFLEISGLGSANEQGLLGMSFDPNYATNGYFYVLYVRDDNSVQIERYTVMGDPATSNVADASSARTIVSVQQPFEIHNGGWLGFGPTDGMLYIPTGDGGDPNSPQQLTGSLQGKILRIDVHGDDFPADESRNYAIPQDNPFVGQVGEEEIWGYGLRNPFRASFDRATGDLWVGDVGQATRDEINLQRADSTGGENYGWSLREGNIETPGDLGGPPPPGNVDPVYDYEHDGPDPNFSGSSVIGGYVYHGSVPAFQGHYIFADFISGNIWKLDPDAVDIRASVTNIENVLPQDAGGRSGIVSFAEDAAGELYMMELTGQDVFRIETASKDVVWNGDDVSPPDAIAGDGTSWSDAENWSRDGTPNVAFADEDHVIFAPGSSQSTINLGSNRTAAAVTFQAPYELQSQQLTVLSGNVTVDEGVTATIQSSLTAESIDHSLRKLGSGTLLVEGVALQTVVKEGTLGGGGSIDHLTVRDGATVAPGASTGVLTVDNSFTMWPGATLEIELGGTVAGTQYDQLDIKGGAVLDGIVDVSLIDLGGGLFDPALGDSFEILSALGGITGTFAEAALPSIQEDLKWDINYMRCSVELSVIAAADFDGDGDVDSDDLVHWEGDFGLNADSDADGDGDSDGADFLIWQQQFTGALPTFAAADFDQDGDVDSDDLDIWEGDYGLNADSDADGDGDSDGADFLIWQQQFTGALPTFAAADFDQDGDVDSDDLVHWECDYGLNADSDADGDGDSDGADFLIWQQQFTGTLSAPALPNPVPEPTSMLLSIGFAIVGMLWPQRSSQRRSPLTARVAATARHAVSCN